MKHDHVILRDTDGHLRFPEDLKISDKQAENLADWAFQVTAKDVGVKQLDCTLDEYDRSMGLKRKGGPKRNWNTDEHRYVLLNYEDSNEEVGKAIGRSGMAIKMAKSDILSNFNVWKDANQSLIQGKTREEIVDLYLGKIEVEDE